MMNTEQKTYNGWTNYETWCVNLHITNEQSTQQYWQDAAEESWKSAEDTTSRPHCWTRSEDARIRLADLLKESHHPNHTYGEAAEKLPLMWQDMLGAAFDEVDWMEIANVLLSYVEEYEPID